MHFVRLNMKDSTLYALDVIDLDTQKSFILCCLKLIITVREALELQSSVEGMRELQARNA